LKQPLIHADSTLPVAQPVSGAPAPAPPAADPRQVAIALAQAAAALSAAANALAFSAGVTVAAPVSLSLTQSPPSFPSFPSVNSGLTVSELIREFLLAKARAGRSDRYLRQLRVCLSSFNQGRARVPIAAVTLADIERWAAGAGWSPETIRHYIGDIRTLFGFAVRSQFVTLPASGLLKSAGCPKTTLNCIQTSNFRLQTSALSRCLRPKAKPVRAGWSPSGQTSPPGWNWAAGFL